MTPYNDGFFQIYAACMCAIAIVVIILGVALHINADVIYENNDYLHENAAPSYKTSSSIIGASSIISRGEQRYTVGDVVPGGAFSTGSSVARLTAKGDASYVYETTMESDLYHESGGTYSTGGVYRYYSDVEDQRAYDEMQSHEAHASEYIVLSTLAKWGIESYEIPIRHAVSIDLMLSGGHATHAESGYVETGEMGTADVNLVTRVNDFFNALYGVETEYTDEQIWQDMRYQYKT